MILFVIQIDDDIQSANTPSLSTTSEFYYTIGSEPIT